MRTILIIAAEPEPIEAICSRLEKRGHRVRVARTLQEGLEEHREGGADLVLLGLPLEGASGDTALRKLRSQDPRVLAVVVGSDATVPGAPEALEHGAFDYVADSSADKETLYAIVGMALGARRADAQLRYLRRKDAAGASWETIVGDCEAMRKVFATVRQLCHRTSRHSPPVILITGETGTGKGLLAKAIHYNSVRRSRALVALNCAAIPVHLVEAELFGHERGAFTDAHAARAGLFETADGGTLFLDELGALPLELQSKLLISIEERTIRRLGSSEDIQVNVQIIAATNRDLETMVEEGTFRADLFHRINVVEIGMPALRDRGDDTVVMAESFIAEMSREYGMPPKTLSQEACEAIRSYDWPGNVRELRNQIERIVLLEDDPVIRPEQLQLRAKRQGMAIRAGSGDVDVDLPDGGFSLDGLERAVIRRSLEKHAGNVSKTARYLGISRHTLIYRLRKHGLAKPEAEAR